MPTYVAMSNLVSLLIEARRVLFLSQGSFGELLGSSRRTGQRWEGSGSYPTRQQLAGGVASSAAGLIVSQSAGGPLEHYDRLGYVVSAAIIATVLFMHKINGMVTAYASPPVPAAPPSESPGAT